MDFQVPSNLEDRIAALQSIEELKGLAPEELAWIAGAGDERSVEDGRLVFSQGAPPHHLIFILAGEVMIKRHTSSPVSFLTGRTGRITGKTPFSRIRAWSAEGRASGNVWLLELHESAFPAMLAAIPSMTERIVRLLIDRNREYTRAEEQIGKLSALGKLAGSLAHEMNNPAAAARSAALALSQDSDVAGNDVRYQLGMKFSDRVALDSYIRGMDAIRSQIKSGPHQRSSLDANDLEETLTDWLGGNGFEGAWKLAPILAEAAVSIPQLEEFLAPVAAELYPLALQDLFNTISRDAAIATVTQATGRIFQVVTAVKNYSYMDRQALQKIDLAKALEDVLMMFQPRLINVTIKKEIQPDLPLLEGYGAELNQAFFALIENSLDVMGNRGLLTLAVKLQGDEFLIEVGDDGTGIPEDAKDRVFEPFFTTKPLGSGLGLGLDTVQRVVAKHFGTVAFDTSASGTVFRVRLPIARAEIY